MDLNALEIFQVLAKTLNVTNTADIIDVPSSSVSRKIKILEQELGAALFHRGGKKMSLTPQGEMLLERSTVITNEMNVIRSQISCQDDSMSGAIRLVIPSAFLNLLADDFLISFQEKYPNIHLHIQSRQGRQINELLDFDVAISPNLPKDESLIVKKLYRSKRYFCAGNDFIALHGEPKSPEALTQLPFLSLLHSNVKKEELSWNSGCEQSNIIHINSYASSDSPEALAQMMLANKGVACLPEGLLKKLPADRYKILFDGLIYDANNVYTVYLSRQFRLPRVDVFISELQKHIQQEWESSTII
ncbi:LysR family transcriptional regulator [Shewanella youngdeokensis]|uniref:LysR family transcriptional regulator n=1 Tax=Shewanella youngdeokensis TaxID=2999068 RepID=A0ABZ0K2D6_9GAMM|nr:LysR family transcriptional regulator [Shewanella sp. DAU334]